MSHQILFKQYSLLLGVEFFVGLTHLPSFATFAIFAIFLQEWKVTGWNSLVKLARHEANISAAWFT